MKTLLTLCASCLLVMSASGTEMRTFSSADKSKTFEGVLVGYSSKTDTVQVRRKGARHTTKFKLEMLSVADQEYVRAQEEILRVAASVAIDMEAWKGEAVTQRGETVKTTTTPVAYEITVKNRSSEELKDIEVRYTIYYNKDSESGRASELTLESSFEIDTLFAKYEDTTRTDEINLEKYRRSKSGGG